MNYSSFVCGKDITAKELCHITVCFKYNVTHLLFSRLGMLTF